MADHMHEELDATPALLASESALETRPAGAQASRDFDTVVAIVERKSGDALTGPTREFCRREWLIHPRGVERCALEAAAREGVRTPNGLFVRMLRDYDHIRHEKAWDQEEAPAELSRVLRDVDDVSLERPLDHPEAAATNGDFARAQGADSAPRELTDDELEEIRASLNRLGLDTDHFVRVLAERRRAE